MINRHLLLACGTALAAAALSACAATPDQSEAAKMTGTRERPAPRKIVQLGFGGDAVFAGCIEPACPAVTAKTLASVALVQPVVAAAGTNPSGMSPAVRTSELPDAAGRESAHPPAAAEEAQAPTLVLYFPLAGVALAPADKAALDDLVPLASKARRIGISSRTDSIGSEAANQTVALARANAVRDYLRAKLTAPDEIFVIDAQASCCYIASNDTVEGRKRNRRVEIVLTIAGEMPR